MVARVGHSGMKRRGALGALGLTALLSLLALSAPTAAAEQAGLSDDDAIVVTSSAVYSLDLTSAGLTKVADLSNDGSVEGALGGFAALEASPNDDALYAIDQNTGGDQLVQVDYPTGSASRVGSVLTGQRVHGIARTDSGTTYVTGSLDDGSGTATNQLATLDLSQSTLVPIGPTTAGDTSVLISALFAVDDALYGFGWLDTETLYAVDTTTGALSEVTGFVPDLSGIFVSGADTASDGTVYLVTSDGNGTSWLSTTDLASTSEVGQITGGMAENIAIATLLDSERPEPEPEAEPEPEPEPEPRSDESSRESDSARDGTSLEAEAPAPAPAPAPVAPTPATPLPVEPEQPLELGSDSETVSEAREVNPEPRPGPEAVAPLVPGVTAEPPGQQISLAAVAVAIAVGSLVGGVYRGVDHRSRLRAHSERPRGS